MRVRARAQKRRDPGSMSATEKRYSEILETRRVAGEIYRWDFEVETLVLAKECRYTPDFRVLMPCGEVRFIEVKPAGWKHIPNQANSTTKLKVAAELHPYVFVRAAERTKKEGGGFEEEFIEGR